MNMHVVIVNDFAHVEGGASHVALLGAIGLASRGHDVTLLAAVGPIMPELRASRVRVVCAAQHQIAQDPKRLRAMVQGWWNLRARRLMESILADRDPRTTIVHLHGWTKALSSSVVGPVLRRQFLLVCTLNDYFTACPNGGFFVYPKGHVCRLTPMTSACILTQCDKRGYGHKLWRVARQGVQRRWGMIPKGIRHFVVVSEFSRRILAPYLPHDAVWHDVPNVIDVPRATPIAVERNATYAMVGRLSREKGAALLAQAAEQSGHPLVFIGDGECRDEVNRVNPRAVVTGWGPTSEVLERLRQARALVFPSLWYEAQPLAVREAAALGIPAIVSDGCAARDEVADGVTGLWFRSGDVNDLAAKMSVLNDDETVRRLGRAAYERYWAHPATMDDHVSRLEAVYRQVLEKRIS